MHINSEATVASLPVSPRPPPGSRKIHINAAHKISSLRLNFTAIVDYIRRWEWPSLRANINLYTKH